MSGNRPAHLRPALIGVVALGGAVGTAARYGVAVAVGTSHDVPIATLVVNLSGAFLLGLLLERLIRGGDETGRGRAIRLGLGTGVLGGFTTYSALALEVTTMLNEGRAGTAVVYLAATLVLGLAAAFGGVALGAGRRAAAP